MTEEDSSAEEPRGGTGPTRRGTPPRDYKPRMPRVEPPPPPIDPLSLIKPGPIEVASAGTITFDEIAESSNKWNLKKILICRKRTRGETDDWSLAPGHVLREPNNPNSPAIFTLPFAASFLAGYPYRNSMMFRALVRAASGRYLVVGGRHGTWEAETLFYQHVTSKFALVELRRAGVRPEDFPEDLKAIWRSHLDGSALGGDTTGVEKGRPPSDQPASSQGGLTQTETIPAPAPEQTIPPAAQAAYRSWKEAWTAKPELHDARFSEVYDYLKEEGSDEYPGGMPKFPTWDRDLRVARTALGERRNRPRKGRDHGKSVARADQVENPRIEDWDETG